MAASTNDKFSSPTTTDRPDAATTTAVKANGATSITVDSTTGWETANKVHFTVYEVDASGAKIASTQRDYDGIVNSSTSINTVTIRGGADREFPIGSKVIPAPTAAWADDLVDGITTSLDQDGTLKAGAVDVSAVLADEVVSTAKLADASVTNAKLATDAAVQLYVDEPADLSKATRSWVEVAQVDVTPISGGKMIIRWDYAFGFDTSARTSQFRIKVDGVVLKTFDSIYAAAAQYASSGGNAYKTGLSAGVTYDVSVEVNHTSCYCHVMQLYVTVSK